MKTYNTFLDGERLFLRSLELSDIGDAYLKGINNQQKDIYTDHAIFPKNSEMLKNYATKKWESLNIWLGIFLKKGNTHIGNIEISNIEMIHRKAEYSIIIWNNEGKGYGYEASKLLINHIFYNMNLNRIYLGVHSENLAAINLYLKLGFKKEGVQREAFIQNDIKYDMLTMGLLKKDFKNC